MKVFKLFTISFRRDLGFILVLMIFVNMLSAQHSNIDLQQEMYDLYDEIIGTLYVEKNGEIHLQKAKNLHRKAILSEDVGIMSASAVTIGNIYNHKPIVNNKDSAIFYKTLALQYLTNDANLSERIDRYIDLGVTLKNYGDILQGEEYLFQAIKLLKEKDPRLATCYKIICDFCRHKFEFKEAIHYGELAMMIAKRNNLDINTIYNPLLCLITAYRKNNEPEIALQKANIYLEGVRSNSQLLDQRDYVLNERAEIYLSLGKVEKAIKDLEKNIALVEEFPEKYQQVNRSLYLYLKEDYSTVIPIFESEIQAILDRNEFAFLDDTYNRLIDSYEKVGDIRNALKAQRAFSKLQEVQKEKETESIRKALRIKYEIEKQESTIINQELQLSKQSLIIQYSIGVAILLGLFFLGLFFAFRNNKLKNIQLKKLTNQLQELDQFKNNLYTNITHEFRTPLTVILGMNDNIRGNEKEKNIIKRNSKNLLRLVTQLLDISKLESNNLPITTSRGDLVNYLQYLTESFYSMAEDKNVRLTFFTESNSYICHFDEQKIQHIVYNLLSNAIKFTDEGGKIIVHFKELYETSDEKILLLVQDTGIGIPDHVKPYLFDRFYQADNSHTRKYEGTGVGLAFVSELVKIMDGTIEVESHMGKGSIFKVFIPMKKINESSSQYAPHKKPSYIASAASNFKIDTSNNNRRTSETNTVDQLIDSTSKKPLILLVEDNIDITQYIVDLLADQYQIHTAKNGKLGVSKAIEIIPDIIISDVMMPFMDGYELCDILKSNELTNHIPIILLTAKASTLDRVDGLQKGADAYLTKPFNKDELFIRIDKLIALRKILQARFSSDQNTVVDKSNVQEDLVIQKAKKIILENMSNSDFGVTELGNALFMSKTQVYRKIKALTDRSPSGLIRFIKLEMAKTLLSNHEKSISEIAYEVGFNDPNYFSRCFHDEYNNPPSAYRK